MTNERFLLDTVFVQALIDKADQHHKQAVTLYPRVRQAREVWITEAVLTEIANALRKINRIEAGRFVEQCYNAHNMKIVPVDTPLFKRALSIYTSHNDKTWSLTDCISFVVMHERNLEIAVTHDKDFIQAGFRALMREQKID